MDIPQIEYSTEYVNLMVLLVGIVIITFFLSKRFARKRILLFGNYETLEKVMGEPLIPRGLLPLILRLMVMILIVAALSHITMTKEGYTSKTDFVLAIDISESMQTEDYEPTRLEFVKRETVEWLSKLGNVRVGLVTFSGKAYMKSEPTDDMEVLRMRIEDITNEPPAGTAIGDAIILSSGLMNGIRERGKRNKTIILITDGRNNVGINITDALNSLNYSDIRINAIGIGSREEHVSEIPSHLLDKNATATRFPELDDGTLRYLANKTNGKYFIIDDENALGDAFRSGLEVREISEEVTKYILFALCIILLLEWSVEITKYRPIP